MRLGVYQAACGGQAFPDRVRKLSRLLKGKALDLLVCPELFTTGYHIDSSHQTLAQPCRGTFFEGMAELAVKHQTAIAYGYPESEGGRVFNAAAIVGADGALLANHRKRLQSPNSFEETTFDNGDEATCINLNGICVAVAICYEVELPETARGAALGGADLLIVPTALVDAWPIVAEKTIPARAFENGMWIAYANHGGSEGEYNYLGGSRIVAPTGLEAAIAGPREELITATVDAQSVVAARERMPYLRDCKKIAKDQ